MKDGVQALWPGEGKRMGKEKAKGWEERRKRMRTREKEKVEKGKAKA